MPFFLSLAAALVVSMALMPMAIRAAPVLGLVDEPDPRKVHSVPIPRVGGIGIVVGALVSLLIWLSADPLYQSFFLGALVLFGFGLWDDRVQMGHYTKFAGQIIAAGLVVFYGGLYVERFPFMSPELLDPIIGKLITLIALVGVINAVNHSDGLDGLAGGLTLLSLAAIAAIAYPSDGEESVIIALAVAGGILGFLRFNTYPATVFMGDSGSQFLGFSSGFLVVLLTQRVNPALSPALPVLLLGLPLADILVVFYLRVSGGMNWFKATRNHVHHRLLDLGVSHQSAVVTIYGIQLLFVSSALLLKYQSDASILSVYSLMVIAVFAVLLLAERERAAGKELRLSVRGFGDLTRFRVVRQGPIRVLAVLVPFYLIAVAVTVTQVPPDFSVASAALFLVVGAAVLNKRFRSANLPKTAVFTLAVFCTYLWVVYLPPALTDDVVVGKVFFILVMAAVALSLKFAMDVEFRTTAMDYLAVFLVLLLGLFPVEELFEVRFSSIVVKSIVLLYACEVMLSRKGWVPTTLYLASLVSLAALAVRGLA